MLFWLAFALMTGAAVLAVLLPLARRRAADDRARDLAVYRDQLAEIDRDQARGVLAATEAEGARLEVKRRLLAASDRTSPVAAGAGTLRRRIVAVVALAGVPAVALATYFAIGHPGLEDQPLAARLERAPASHDVIALVAQVEAHLQRNPEDGRGWEALAPVYLRTGRYREAVKARSSALRLLGPTPDREADLGEAIYAADNGVVTAQAREAFERALKLDPHHPKAAFFIGLGLEQDGKPQDAAARWRAILAVSPADAPWRPTVEQALARIGAPAPAGPGPTAEEMAAAQALPASDRMAMIRGMVDGLAERLKTDTGDIDGWLRLVRAHQVLGETEKAKAAAAAARAALAADPDKLKRLDDLVKGLGLEG